MSRHVERIGFREVVAGGLITAAVLIAVVVGSALLFQPAGPGRPQDAPAPAGPCPAADVLPESAVPVRAGLLIECPHSFDGRLVRYQGEVVRAVLQRGERAWLQVNDDPYALELGPLPEHGAAVGGNAGIAVSVAASVAEQITHVGNHRFQGDLVEVTGVFRRADPGDGGGPAIEARATRILEPGRRIPRAVDGARLATATVLALAAVGATVLAGRRRQRP